MIPRERLEGVLNHLMFHKAIIYEEDRARQIDQYLEVLERDEEESLTSIDDSDRSFEIVFELVLRNDLNPWDIDLMEFSRLYSERMEDRGIDFIVAGKLLFMAWTILRRQSEEVLTFQERADRDELFCLDWDVDSMGLFVNEEVPFLDEFDPGQVELCEVVRHRERRPVMLVELLDAFDEAQREAKIRLERAVLRDGEEETFDEKIHTDELERDVMEVWKRITVCGGGPIAIEDLFDGTKEDLIKVFLSVLFLAMMGKISLWQDDLPHGQIFLEVKMPWDIGTLEDVPEVRAEVPDERVVM